MRTLSLLALSAAACGASPPRAGGPGDAAALIACWRDAIGGADRLAAIHAIEREARTEASGLTGTLHSWSRADGAYREDNVLGPSSDTSVYAGGRGWSRSGLGAPLELAHRELAQLASAAYLESFAPLVAGRMAGAVRAGSEPHSVVVTAAGGLDDHIALDPHTCLPQRLEQDRGPVHVTITWPRWETAGGIRLPAEAAIDLSTGDRERVAYTATRIDPALPAGVFAAPGVDPRARIPHLTEPLSLPAMLTRNHVYIQGRINGKGPAALLVDTGAGGLVLDQARAAALGLSGAGAMPLRGAGEGKLDAGLVALPTVELGGASFGFEVAYTAPLTALSHYEGRPMEAVMGYELLGHYVAEFDYAAPAVRLHDPASFQPPPDAIALPFYFWDTKPIVELGLELSDGRTFTVTTLIDTGDGGAFSLGTNFVRRHRAADAPAKVLRAPLGFGVGGQSKQAIGRVAAVRLGAIAFRDVVTSFSEDTRGVHADDAIDAYLGSEAMKQLTVWFDYPHRRMWVRKNAHFGEPFAYDASGMIVMSPDDTYHRAVVSNVLPGSPAAEAGVALDDELLAVDGDKVSALTIDAIRARLRRAGDRVRVELRRGDATRTVELALRALI